MAAFYAIRNLLDMVPGIRRLATSPPIRAIVEPVLGAHAVAVRGLLFDKTPEANWKVPWHQDRTIAVKTRVNAPDFGPWSTKAGVLHVQSSVFVLENMLAVRIHLDDCGESNGPVRVIPGSHLRGRLSTGQVVQISTAPAVSCAVAAGGSAPDAAASVTRLFRLPIAPAPPGHTPGVRRRRIAGQAGVVFRTLLA